MTRSFLDSFWHCTQSQSIHAVRILENSTCHMASSTWPSSTSTSTKYYISAYHAVDEAIPAVGLIFSIYHSARQRAPYFSWRSKMIQTPVRDDNSQYLGMIIVSSAGNNQATGRPLTPFGLYKMPSLVASARPLSIVRNGGHYLINCNDVDKSRMV